MNKKNMDSKKDKFFGVIRRFKGEICFSILVLVIPFAMEYIIIHGKYRPDGFDNEVWFSFMGSYLGAIVTLIVMYVTFKKSEYDNNKQMKFLINKQDIENEKNSVERVCNLLLLCNYSLTGNHVEADLSMFGRNLMSMQFQINQIRSNGYNAKARDALLDELQSLQNEQVKIMETHDTYIDSIIDPLQKVRMQREEFVKQAFDLKVSTNNRRINISFLYDNYLQETKERIYNYNN